jgi:hypothetical protein
MTTIAMHTMKAQDLRVGNWVEFIDFPAKYFTKVTPKILSIINDYPKNHTWFSVPLTPEILEKCGFKKWDKFNIFSIEFKNGNEIQIDLNKGEVFLGGSESCVSNMGFYSNAKYLHQLQNLYFALTGEELEVNL